MSYNGRLLVRVTSAGGAFPVEGAIVRVEGRSREVDGLLRALVTDRDGQTEILSIPAPDPALSLSPGASAPPYSTLDVFVPRQRVQTDNFKWYADISQLAFNGIGHSVINNNPLIWRCGLCIHILDTQFEGSFTVSGRRYTITFFTHAESSTVSARMPL